MVGVSLVPPQPPELSSSFLPSGSFSPLLGLSSLGARSPAPLESPSLVESSVSSDETIACYAAAMKAGEGTRAQATCREATMLSFLFRPRIPSRLPFGAGR